MRTRLAERYYVTVPERVLRQRSIAATLAALEDPYTEYLSPFAVAELSRRTQPTYAGIGVQLLPGHGGLVVAGHHRRPGPPCRAPRGRPYRRDRRHRDRAARVRAGGGADPGSSRHVGPPGGTARCPPAEPHRSARPDQEPTDFRPAPSRRRRLCPRARVRRRHDGRAPPGLGRLERSGAGRLVLDLRNNPGGLLDEAVGSASIFVGGRKLLTIEGEHEATHELRAPADATVSPVRLALLVNRYTASAAEVVAAALRDNERASLVGERTYGKALVQSIEPLPSGGALKLTTARYVTPSGTDISRRGLLPDVEVVDDPSTAEDEALDTAIATLE